MISRATKSVRRGVAEYGWSRCLGKKAFKTRAVAFAAASDYGHRVYECSVCGWFHLTLTVQP